MGWKCNARLYQNGNKSPMTSSSISRINQILAESELEQATSKYEAAEVIRIADNDVMLKRVRKRREGRPVSVSLSRGARTPTVYSKRTMNRPKRYPEAVEGVGGAEAKEQKQLRKQDRNSAAPPSMNDAFYRRWGFNDRRWNDKDQTVGTVQRDCDWWRSSLPSTDHFRVDALDKSCRQHESPTGTHSHCWGNGTGCGTSGCADLNCVCAKSLGSATPSRPASCLTEQLGKVDRTLRASSHSRGGGGSQIPLVHRKRNLTRTMYGPACYQSVLLSTKTRERLATACSERLEITKAPEPL